MPKNNHRTSQTAAHLRAAAHLFSLGWNNAQLLFVVSLLLLATSIGLLTAAGERLTRTAAPYAKPATPFNVGASITNGQVSVTVASVKLAGGQGPFQTTDSEQYAVVTLHVRNNSDSPIQVLPSNDTYVKDATGKVSYLTPYTLENPFRAGELSPGESIQGQLSYKISTAGKHTFFIDARWSGSVLPFAVD